MLPTTRVPNLIDYSGLPSEELDDIRPLMGRGDSADANARYLKLWKVADNMATGNTGLIQGLVAGGISAELIDFYLDGNAESLGPISSEVAVLAESLESKLHAQFVIAMTHEYLVWSSVIKRFEYWVCILMEVEALSQELESCDWEIKWPFWDQHRALLNLHTYYAHLADLYRKPFHLLWDDIDAFRSFQTGLRSPTPLDFLFDPFLTAVEAAFLPNLEQFLETKTQALARLAAFRFILEAIESGRIGAVPTDPFTGRPSA